MKMARSAASVECTVARLSRSPVRTDICLSSFALNATACSMRNLLQSLWPLASSNRASALATASIDASLRRLGVDYIDLYQIHRYDPYTPIEETLEALNDLVRMGKVLYLGASSMFAWQFARMLALAEQRGYSRFVSMQNHYNAVYREEEREMIPLCQAEGIAIIPWSPLARGFLTGNRVAAAQGDTLRSRSDDFAHRMYYQPDDFKVVAAVQAIASARGVPSAQIALAWLLAQPGVTAPIIGASKLAHLEDAVAALSLQLNAAELAALSEPYRPHPVLGIKA